MTGRLEAKFAPAFSRDLKKKADKRNWNLTELEAVDEDGVGILSSGDEVGDVQVRFSYDTLESAEPVTLVGRQRGDRIVLEEEEHLSDAEHVQPGIVSREEFLDAISAEDASSRWYGVGFFVLGAILFLASLNLGRG